jgi:hypothetical protein
MTKKIRPQSKKQNLVEQELDGELLIYDLERDRALCLNQTSALVWQACDGKRTITEINDLLGKQLDTQTDEDIVWFALDQLSKEKLIEPPVGLHSKFGGMSRRQVIKKIGVGSMIALPVVAGLVAPTAIHAQTLLAPGAFSGNATHTSGCGNAGQQGNRDAACDSATGSLCASTNARQQQTGTCLGPPGGPSTFSCECF